MSESPTMSSGQLPTTPAVERALREAHLMPAVTLSPENMFRCPGCDCEPVGYAPHNGQGDCPPKGADRTDGRIPVDPEWDRMTDDQRQAYSEAVVAEIGGDSTIGDRDAD